ncbi:hypothetical protein CLU79DRAFT_261164 [Phycomyces nitens]|nr:hypothetical protein CLU79DRAFT_261164 [Phycomyces nitens]
MQPRRGKNLPEGSLDSRAKKLNPQDKEDYDFTMEWLAENANTIFRKEDGTVQGLRHLSEVSLCKAHSSTLYRAKKRFERSKNQAPPSPADSNGMDTSEDHRHQPTPYLDPYPYSVHHHPLTEVVNGGLAAKVREISYQDNHYRHEPSPDFSSMTPSTSLKRKRLTKHMDHKPHQSASTPLYASSTAFLSHHHPPSPSVSVQPSANPRPPPSHHDAFSSQLPPLHSRSHTLTSLPQPHISITPSPSMPLSPPAVETVSLRSVPQPDSSPMYYIRNLAITDAFTFRDLLAELDMTGSPPAGKRIIVSNAKNDLVFPLDQAIRSVIRRPPTSHVELCLGLAEKTAVDWSTYA